MTEQEIECLFQQSIPRIQKELAERDKVERITVEEMESLLAFERANKNRLGIAEWLKLGIQMGKLPGEYYLTYHDKTGCFKSALQKYIRRSQTEKALGAGRALWRIGKEAAVGRLKIIIPEETHCSVGLLNHFVEEMNESTYLGIIKEVADAPKDKSSCPLACRMVEEAKRDVVFPDEGFIKRNLTNRSRLPEVSRQIFEMCRMGGHEQAIRILRDTRVVRELIGRQKEGTRWEDDSTLLVIAAVRFAQGDYDPFITIQHIDPKTIEPMKLAQIDWYCFDFHTAVGRIAERWFLARHRNINQKTLRHNWFMSEGGKVEGRIIKSEWDEEEYDRDFWAQYGREIEGLVRQVMGRFQLEKYEQVHNVTANR